MCLSNKVGLYFNSTGHLFYDDLIDVSWFGYLATVLWLFYWNKWIELPRRGRWLRKGQYDSMRITLTPCKGPAVFSVKTRLFWKIYHPILYWYHKFNQFCFGVESFFISIISGALPCRINWYNLLIYVLICTPLRKV